MGVLTVTLNPAIDETIRIERLVRGQVHRAQSVAHNAGGKGVDVASCLVDWGTSVTVTGFLGAKNDALFEKLFKAKGIYDRFVRVEEETRINITIVDDEETTNIYLPGLVATTHDIAILEKVMDDMIEESPPDIAVLSGSLPTGCPSDIYAQMTETFAQKRIRVLADTSGEALKKLLDADTLPFCVKPNKAELSEAVGRPLEDMDAIAAEARSLNDRGINLVVVSLGEDGALFSSGDQVFIASKEATLAGSTVGAGDVMVAGGDLMRIARLSTAFAVGKLGLFGPNLPDRTSLESIAEQVRIRRLRPRLRS